MTNQEELVPQDCGGEVQEWINGINELLMQEDILLERTEFKHVRPFCYEGLVNLLFPFEGVKLDLGKLAIWRIKSHETFGDTWLSDYVPNRLGGLLDEAPTQKTGEIQQPGEHPSHSAWKGEEASLGRMSMKQQMDRGITNQLVFVRSVHRRKMVNHELKDYTVNAAITFHTGFDGREYNYLMYEGMKKVIRRDIQTAFLSDGSLKDYITSDPTLRFSSDYKVWVEYEFSCYDENKQEAEGFSNYCVKGVQNRLEKLGCRIESISSKAEGMDMG